MRGKTSLSSGKEIEFEDEDEKDGRKESENDNDDSKEAYFSSTEIYAFIFWIITYVFLGK